MTPTTPAQARELASYAIPGNETLRCEARDALRSLADQLEAAQAELQRPESTEMTLTKTALKIVTQERDAYKLDAERYRWLRNQHWYDGPMCVVLCPKKNVLIGSICPTGSDLDSDIDAAIKGAAHD